MKAYRAALLRFDEHHQPLFDADGLLVTGPDAGGQQVVRAAGSCAALADRFPGLAIEHLPGRLIAPGFGWSSGLSAAPACCRPPIW